MKTEKIPLHESGDGRFHLTFRRRAMKIKQTALTRYEGRGRMDAEAVIQMGISASNMQYI